MTVPYHQTNEGHFITSLLDLITDPSAPITVELARKMEATKLAMSRKQRVAMKLAACERNRLRHAEQTPTGQVAPKVAANRQQRLDKNAPADDTVIATFNAAEGNTCKRIQTTAKAHPELSASVIVASLIACGVHKSTAAIQTKKGRA